MAREASLPTHDVADLRLAAEGERRIAWAGEQMPVLAQVRERFARERPLDGLRIAACLHVTAETANLMLALAAGGGEPVLCSANPLSAQDDVAAALVAEHAISVRAAHGESVDAYAAHVRATLETEGGRVPQITVDDGERAVPVDALRVHLLGVHTGAEASQHAEAHRLTDRLTAHAVKVVDEVDDRLRLRGRRGRVERHRGRRYGRLRGRGRLRRRLRGRGRGDRTVGLQLWRHASCFPRRDRS